MKQPIVDESTPDHAEEVAFPSAIRGVLTGFSETGEPLVDFGGNPAETPISAGSTVSLSLSDVTREALLVFEDGDARRPIVIGILQSPGVRSDLQLTSPVAMTADDERITLSATKEIVMSCGQASITLTRAGKVLIRGAYVLTRSSGVNRIKGGSVQIN